MADCCAPDWPALRAAARGRLLRRGQAAVRVVSREPSGLCGGAFWEALTCHTGSTIGLREFGHAGVVGRSGPTSQMLLPWLGTSSPLPCSGGTTGPGTMPAPLSHLRTTTTFAQAHRGHTGPRQPAKRWTDLATLTIESHGREWYAPRGVSRRLTLARRPSSRWGREWAVVTHCGNSTILFTAQFIVLMAVTDQEMQ